MAEEMWIRIAIINMGFGANPLGSQTTVLILIAPFEQQITRRSW